MDSWNLGPGVPLTWGLQQRSLAGTFSPSGGSRAFDVSSPVVSTAVRVGFAGGRPRIVLCGPRHSHSSWAWKHLEDEDHKGGSIGGVNQVQYGAPRVPLKGHAAAVLTLGHASVGSLESRND